MDRVTLLCLRHPDNCRGHPRPVLEVYRFEHAAFVDSTVADETIRSTDNHPFWVMKGEDLDDRPELLYLQPPAEGTAVPGRWVEAGDLRLGDVLLLKELGRAPVTALRTWHERQTVYNFAVDGLHCYAVGVPEALVHNDCGGELIPSKALLDSAAKIKSEDSVRDKLSRYLLNPDHTAGGPKANWFKSALGFTRENLADLTKQIKFDPQKAIATVATEYGQKFEQTIAIHGANGKTIDVLFVWIKNHDGVVRLVTAIPTSP